MDGLLPGEPIRREFTYRDVSYKTAHFKQTVQAARDRSGGDWGGGGEQENNHIYRRLALHSKPTFRGDQLPETSP